MDSEDESHSDELGVTEGGASNNDMQLVEEGNLPLLPEKNEIKELYISQIETETNKKS